MSSKAVSCVLETSVEMRVPQDERFVLVALLSAEAVALLFLGLLLWVSRKEKYCSANGLRAIIEAQMIAQCSSTILRKVQCQVSQ
jgi:hypothetical protein